MTHGIRPRSPDKNLWFLAGLAVISVVLAVPLEARQARKDHRKMATPLAALHPLLAKLRQQKPFTQARVQELFKAKLVEKDRNAYFAFLESANVSVDGGVQLDKIDLRLRIDGEPHPGFLVLTVAKPCISLAELTTQYGALKLTQIPTGRSPEEQHSYSLEDNWGKMSFGFAEKAPGCVASIALEPK
jgi:hypothetical protein